MNLVKVHRTISKLKPTLINYSNAVALEQNEYTETPEYPPIVDTSLQGRKLRERQTLYEKIKKVNTVEEKQIALNMPRFYGWRCINLSDNFVPYNAMPLIKCYTRTHFIPSETLPNIYSDTVTDAETATKDLRSFIEEAIAIEVAGVEHLFIDSDIKLPINVQKEDALAKCIVRQINRIITNYLSDKFPHILSAQTDYEPRHEAFWFIGGVDVPPAVSNWRKQYDGLKDRLYEPIDRPVQYRGIPFLALRSRHPLKPLIPYSEAENPDFKVPKFTFEPVNVGYGIQHCHGTNIPGYWTGDPDEFGLLSIHGRGHILSRMESYGAEDQLEALHCQAMKASFGWLLAQANYQGFTTYNDLTYPLVSQTVITNGQLWSFYAYQLNTIVMHNDEIDTNPKHNICFGLKPLKLYDTIENGQVKGLNEDVLKVLLQFYMNVPEKRDYDMKPYLGQEEKVIADIEDDKRRCWLESRYKHLVSNRPKHNLIPEIYDWEKIYKIRFNTRFFERKVRPFALGINPYKRRLDDHLPEYIPKALRSFPKSKKKFEKTYYPDV